MVEKIYIRKPEQCKSKWTMNRHEKQWALFRKRFSCSQFDAYIQLTLPFAAHRCRALTFTRASFKNVATLPVTAYCSTRSVAYLTSMGQQSQGTIQPKHLAPSYCSKKLLCRRTVRGGVKICRRIVRWRTVRSEKCPSRRSVLVGDVSAPLVAQI